MAESSDLLFFDTFSHESSEELNLDLVQFPKPVYVAEVRIIPLGARVQGDFPGGVRLGATNPTQFHIDFFVNDLSKPGASTFETLGSLEYCQNGRIHMDCEGSVDQPRQIPTDGLVLRGWYTTITLAVYGSITKGVSEQTGVVSREEVPPPPRVSTPPDPIPVAQPGWTDPAPPAEIYPPPDYPPDAYDRPAYQPDYYGRDGPKDPRAYHHSSDDGSLAWSKREDKDRRDGRSRDDDRPRRSPAGSVSGERTRSHGRDSPRYSRSRSRERDYPSGRDNYRRDGSISPAYRDRPSSRDRPSYKREDYRRPRPPSYERSRGGSYEKRSSTYEKRSSPFEKRPPSYERRAPSYERRSSPYGERGPPFEKRAPSYERRRDKRATSPAPLRERDGFDCRSHSPTRDDPRKRPRTPPAGSPRRPRTPDATRVRTDLSPVDSVLSDEGVAEYDRDGEPLLSGDDAYRKGCKIRKLSLKSDALPKPADDRTSPSSKTGTPPESPRPGQEDNASVDAEPFEPILSDEDILDDADGTFGEMEYDIGDYCPVDDILKCYNPFRADWQTYTETNRSALFASSDVECKKDVMKLSIEELCKLSVDFRKLLEIVADFKKVEDKFSPSNFTQRTADAREEWVHIREQLPFLINNIANESDILLKIFRTKTEVDRCLEYGNVLSFLINCCRVGLDYDLALSQEQATFKIRHIKCGIRLVEALCSSKQSGDVVIGLLKNDMSVFSNILELYSKEYMAQSIKLMLLKALDVSLGSEEAIEHFLTPHIHWNFVKGVKAEGGSDSSTNDFKNGYQMLIIMLSKNPLSRVKFALNALINKINFYELLKKLREHVCNLSPTENCSEGEREISETEIELVINSLEEVLSVYRNGSFELSQPRNFLPVSKQFDINKSSMNGVLLDFFRIHKLLETCLFLLTCPLTYNYPVITNPIYDLISLLADCHEGLLYLFENMKTSELIFRCLLQPFTQQSDEDQLMVLQDTGNCSASQQLGLEMAYRLQSIYYINAIFDLQSAKEENESELFEKLHGLYCLGFGGMGKLALANILSMGDNILCLLNVFEKDIHSKQVDRDDFHATKEKSPSKNYAVDLTVSTVQFSSDVNFLKKYGWRILNIAKKYDLFEQSIASNLQDVLPYLKPLEKSNIFDSISGLIEILKVSVEHVTSAPGDLITGLRILHHLGIADYENKRLSLGDNSRQEYMELKYKDAILQLFSMDGVPHIVSILEKLCGYFEQPSLHTATFVSVHGLHLANIVLLSLELLNKMLTYVIQGRNTQFKDLTGVSTILQTYNLMYSYPSCAVSHKLAQKSCREAIETLLAYTQPFAEDASENESIHKSLWTMLCAEIIKYILTAPYTFIPGLLILSEMLPLPLPIQTKFTLSDGERSNMVSNRRLWSAHLHTLSSNITEMIQIICLSACQPVIQLLRRVCIQLTDLAPNTSLIVSKAILDLLVKTVCGENNFMAQPPEPADYNVARLLNFLACLLTHPSVKCTALHLMRQCTAVPKSEDGYWLIVPILCGVMTTVSESQPHIQSQECVVSILSSLCDTEITLLTHIDQTPALKMEVQDESVENTKTSMTSEVYLANALPSKETLTALINATFEYISSDNSLFSLISSILRTYFLLTEHDFGFYYLKTCLEKNRVVFVNLFMKIVNCLGKESFECVSTFLELLKILQSIPDELESAEGIQFSSRTIFIRTSEMADLIGWYKNKEQHPLFALENFLKDANEEDLLAQVRQLLLIMQGCSPGGGGVTSEALPPPASLSPEPLIGQFSGRALWIQGDAQDERLASAYWLGVVQPQTEEDAAEAEMIPCDLSEVTRLYLPTGTDLVAESERLLHLPPAPPRPPSEPPMFRTKRLHVPRDRRPYVSPARGRGASQASNNCVVGSMTLSSSAGGASSSAGRPPVDAFRSRPPNTSRPPSLHVDDFIALEGCGAQPTGPTGYNKMPPITARGGRGMRTRGINITDRGRFASSMPAIPLFHTRRGRGSWASGGSAGVSGAGESSPPLSQHYNRQQSSQHFQPPIMQHSNSQYSGSSNWGGMNRGGRGGRGLRHGRPTFLR